MQAFVITQLMNNTMYYLQQAGGPGNTWISNKYLAQKFPTRGNAEYFACLQGIKNYLVKEVDQ